MFKENVKQNRKILDLFFDCRSIDHLARDTSVETSQSPFFKRVAKTSHNLDTKMKIAAQLASLCVLLLMSFSCGARALTGAEASAASAAVFEGSPPDGAPATLLELESALAAAGSGWEPEATALPHLSLQQEAATPWDAFECACTVEPRD